jgi:hypothetical protein
VRFPSALFLFRKVLFTLDGVLNDIADVRIDTVMAAAFLTRWLASFGLFHAPLETRELGSVLWSGVTYFARASHGAEPSRSRK